jgi:two-component system, chemotaxis family, sensor kinase CheA
MEKILENLSRQLDELALKAVMVDVGDIPALGDILTSCEAIEANALKHDLGILLSIVEGMKNYIEKVILSERTDLSPVEEAISGLQEICRNVAKEKSVEADIAALLKIFEKQEGPEGCQEIESEDACATEPNDSSAVSDAADSASVDEQPEAIREQPSALSSEDKEIIVDFVSESLENLSTIEVRLMDLEQDPEDADTINAIFRPFHTVKGVSGFLNFNKINALSHTVENLLDKARNGDIKINEEIVDVVLESVDLLERMLGNVQSSLSSGVPTEGDSSIENLTERVAYFIDFADGKADKPIGEILITNEVIQEQDLAEALEVQQDAPDKKIGEILVAEKKAAPKEVIHALRDQKRSGQPVSLHIKIDTNKLDNVVDMVGELAIAQSMLRQSDIIKNNNRKTDHIVNQLSQIISALQKTAMSLRMVPIKHTFQKMVRLVRDLARKAKKEIQLEMSGEDTEIDRNMVEEIYEPMVHMIRNSVDHGLESPDEREAVNKPRKGTICLRAYHKGGNIVIEIEDDGKGLNREKILEKAIDKGLVRDGEKLTEAEINNLIFHPGFSTADKITDISGRGVGMDVVKSKIIERLRGSVEIQTIQGKSTAVQIRLPLTLAIIDGMIVKVNGSRFIIPTLTIQESFRPQKDEYFTVKGEGEMVKVRDRLVPLIRLDRIMDMHGDNGADGSDLSEIPPWERLVVVVENQDRRRCLLIDELLGQEEVVIKSLGESLKDVKGISGGAIMGDGKVSLILDIVRLFEMTSEG